jgi:hypothetical protein
MTVELTAAVIQKDIAKYRERIRVVRDKLAQLPMTASHWRDRKKLISKRRYLEGEIAHVKKLIGMAEEALRVTRENTLHLATYKEWRHHASTHSCELALWS